MYTRVLRDSRTATLPQLFLKGMVALAIENREFGMVKHLEERGLDIFASDES